MTPLTSSLETFDSFDIAWPMLLHFLRAHVLATPGRPPARRESAAGWRHARCRYGGLFPWVACAATRPAPPIRAPPGRRAWVLVDQGAGLGHLLLIVSAAASGSAPGSAGVLPAAASVRGSMVTVVFVGGARDDLPCVTRRAHQVAHQRLQYGQHQHQQYDHATQQLRHVEE